MPAILAGGGLALARCLGEFGSVVLISGNIPNKTEVSSVFISKQIEGDNLTGAASVSVALLVLSLLMLLAVGAVQARGARRGK
jgi:sulfate/thiosulfate transport system permease protein